MNTDKHRLKKILSVFIFVHLWLFFLVSCQTAPTDLRSLAPAETLVYLETNNLAQALNALTENETFKKLSAQKTDFSVLENVQIAVAVTGFETSEKQITDGQAILNFKPRFVAVAETRAWNWQALSLVENNLGAFLRQTYGEDIKVEKSNQNGGTFFTWTAKDGRKVFAFVLGSLVYFGNDAAAIEKALAVKRGEAESLLQNDSLARARSSAENTLAFGFITSEGVAQIASLAGVSTAVEASEEAAPRSFIAKVLPQILQKSVREIVWTAQKTERGIEDFYQIQTVPEVSSVLKETLIPASNKQIESAEFLPPEVFSVTRYNLQNPQIAWRSLLLTAARATDSVSAKILIAFSDSVFAPYGVADSETFLNAIGSDILTARFDDEGAKSIAIVTPKDAEAVKKSLSAEINFKKSVEKQGEAEIWKSEDESLIAAFAGNKLILGDAGSVLQSLQAKQSGLNFTKTGHFQRLYGSDAMVVT
ncbi:MAG TPA: hypothetical protein VK892_14855, partial [Pyrinomonadaceae bacterium]|nr:hypothetical protein [Pyrinomonadaceae bacterium]